MKFNNLRTIQKLAILADLAGIIKPVHPSRRAYLLPNETEEVDATKYGLSSSLRYLKLLRSFQIEVTTKDKPGFGVNFLQESQGKDAVAFVDMPPVLDYSEHMGLGKYGIGNNIVIKSEDTAKSLTEVINFLKSFEKILKTSNDVSNGFQLMVNQLPKLENIDEEYLDRLFVNKPLAHRLSVVRNYMLNRGVVNTHHPFFNELLTTDGIPEYTVTESLEVYHTASESNDKAYILQFIFGDSGDDLVEVFCGQRKDLKLERIGAFIPDYEDDIKTFIDGIKVKIEEIVLASKYRDDVINKLNYFFEQLDKLEINKEDNQLGTKDYYDID